MTTSQKNKTTTTISACSCNSQSHINRKKGLMPIVGENPKILILGTFPGDKSLQMQEYYSNPTNCFWDTIANIYYSGQTFNSYADKISCIRNNNLALWDIIRCCDRIGSLDNKIDNPILNDLCQFLKLYPSITHIAFNGQEAANHFKNLCCNCKKFGNIKTCVLPSTSNTNTHSTKLEKIDEWKKLLLH